MWFQALVDAGIRFDGLDQIPNEYWRNDPWHSRKPWYRVRLLDTEKTLKLGCRKRVYHMEIQPGGEGHFDPQVAKAAWEKEKVTQEIGTDSLYIHAWSEAKVRIYMLDFAKILGLDKPKPDLEDMMRTGAYA